MNFVCHKRTCPGLKLRDRHCHKCGLTLSFSGLLGYGWKRVWEWVKKKLSVACPTCRKRIPAFQSICPACKASLTVEGAFQKTFGPQVEKVRVLIAPNPSKRRLFQWFYVGVSALVFWGCLAILEKKYAQHWVEPAMLSIVYLAVFLILSLWLVPQRTLLLIAQRASKLIKLALVFNYLTALMLLQMFMATWWTRSIMLGVLFFVTWAGAWLFWRYLWPVSSAVGGIFMGPSSTFDPSEPQGRNVRMD